MSYAARPGGIADGLPEEVRALFGATALPEEALAEIGRAVVQFGILEHTLVRLVQGLLGLQDSGQGERVVRALTSEHSFRGLCDLSASLIREIHGDGVAEEYKPVLRALEAAELWRNAISHSLWGTSGARAEPTFVRTKYTAKRKKGVDFQREELAIDDLRRGAGKVGAATFELKAFASHELGLFVDY